MNPPLRLFGPGSRPSMRVSGEGGGEDSGRWSAGGPRGGSQGLMTIGNEMVSPRYVSPRKAVRIKNAIRPGQQQITIQQHCEGGEPRG